MVLDAPRGRRPSQRKAREPNPKPPRDRKPGRRPSQKSRRAVVTRRHERQGEPLAPQFLRLVESEESVRRGSRVDGSGFGGNGHFGGGNPGGGLFPTILDKISGGHPIPGPHQFGMLEEVQLQRHRRPERGADGEG